MEHPPCSTVTCRTRHATNVALSGLRTLIEAQVCSVHSKVISFVCSSCCLLSGCITLGRTPGTLDPAVSTIVFPALWKFSVSEVGP